VTSRLAVRVHAGARKGGLVGWMADGALKLAVPEPPEGGRANRAVLALLARSLGLEPGRLEIKGGAGSRSKWIEVEGLERAEMLRRLERALAERSVTDAG
jgi:hypothetical protein